MGYYMEMRDVSFKIKAKDIPSAFEAVKALDGAEDAKDAGGGTYYPDGRVDRHYAWVNRNFSKGQHSLPGLMSEWRWEATVDEDTGDVTSVSFDGEKYGDDQILFDAIAPFVVPGSYVEMRGEEGEIWRWYFDGETCEEQHATVTVSY